MTDGETDDRGPRTFDVPDLTGTSLRAVRDLPAAYVAEALRAARAGGDDLKTETSCSQAGSIDPPAGDAPSEPGGTP